MKSHRGLSSVIGAVFLIAIVVGALSYVSYSFEIMGDFSEALITEESRLKEKQNEAFEITSMDFTAANKLDVVIKNTGQIPVKITTLYIDEIGVNDVVNKTTINETISPGSSFDFISENIDIDINPTKGYNLKLITSRGETQTFYLNSASQEPLDIRLIASPEIIPTGFSTTLMMVVVNNMSNNNSLINLTPIEPACSGICSKLSGPTPTTYDTLNRGDAAIFEWSYALDGDDDDSITFTSGIENGFPGNTDSETVTIKTVELSEVAGESIVSSGFGNPTLEDLLVLHTETFGVPVAPPPPPGPIPDPLRNYELNGDATDELGGTDLQLSDSGSGLTNTGWEFLKADKAQIVAGEVPALEYAIEIVFSFDDSSWDRVLDYHNLLGHYQSPNNPQWGLYAIPGEFNFWSLGVTGGAMSAGALTHVLIQRTASGTFEMYQDGSGPPIMTFNDNIGQTGNEEATFRGSPGDQNTLQPATFFRDDSGEDSDGFVDCIRVWDTAFSSDDANIITSDSDTCYSFSTSAAAISQMSPSIPEQSGALHIFDDTSDSFQWFSANATVGETTISAGVWNASLRYNSDRLPSGMAAGASAIHDDGEDGGHTLHFNTDLTTAEEDSGQDSTCTDLVDSGTFSVDTWSATGGVNGSGAYYFDGDYISITNGANKKCNDPDKQLFSIAGWFKGDITGSDTRQSIWSKYDEDWGGAGGKGGVIQVVIGGESSDPNEHGVVYFLLVDKDNKKTTCKSDEPDGNGGDNYLDGNWHHFAAVNYESKKCKLYIDGDDDQSVVVIEQADKNKIEFDNDDPDVYIGAKESGTEEFTGYIDDIMFWNNNYILTTNDVTALFEHSFGENSTRLNVYLSNATGAGTTDDVLASDENYGFTWVDPMTHTDVDDLWAGGNWTSTVSEVIMGIDEPYSRLNFTLSYASGAPLNLRVDDSNIDGIASTLISSYLQTPPVDPALPVFRVHDRGNPVTFFAYNAGDEGVWFTYQGTRVVFNGENGHYTGIVDTVDGNLVDEDSDSPFIDENEEANIVFWHPQSTPKASAAVPADQIPEGNYDVTIYLNGYDENGVIFVRSIDLGLIKVVE